VIFLQIKKNFNVDHFNFVAKFILGVSVINVNNFRGAMKVRHCELGVFAIVKVICKMPFVPDFEFMITCAFCQSTFLF
jgi:hypothetical protein